MLLKRIYLSIENGMPDGPELRVRQWWFDVLADATRLRLPDILKERTVARNHQAWRAMRQQMRHHQIMTRRTSSELGVKSSLRRTYSAVMKSRFSG